mmetsp:Transcript_4029/g.10206  ORF Transcript_4029/g.10206 Transcript_4029/m.10206 type:complete len:252 (-) Transcript_4029:520-1275(-)
MTLEDELYMLHGTLDAFEDVLVEVVDCRCELHRLDLAHFHSRVVVLRILEVVLLDDFSLQLGLGLFPFRLKAPVGFHPRVVQMIFFVHPKHDGDDGRRLAPAAVAMAVPVPLSTVLVIIAIAIIVLVVVVVAGDVAADTSGGVEEHGVEIRACDDHRLAVLDCFAQIALHRLSHHAALAPKVRQDVCLLSQPFRGASVVGSAGLAPGAGAMAFRRVPRGWRRSSVLVVVEAPLPQVVRSLDDGKDVVRLED